MIVCGFQGQAATEPPAGQLSAFRGGGGVEDTVGSVWPEQVCALRERVPRAVETSRNPVKMGGVWGQGMGRRELGRASEDPRAEASTGRAGAQTQALVHHLPGPGASRQGCFLLPHPRSTPCPSRRRVQSPSAPCSLPQG